MIRLNLLKYSYIIRPEVRRYFFLLLWWDRTSMEMFPVIILNLSTLLPSIFTKLCLPYPPMWSYVIALRDFCKPNVTKCFGCQGHFRQNNQLPECPRNLIIVSKMRGWEHEGGDNPLEVPYTPVSGGGGFVGHWPPPRFCPTTGVRVPSACGHPISQAELPVVDM